MANIDYTRHYQNWHSDSEEHVRNMVGYYSKRVIPILPQNKSIQSLDIGCGMGFFLLALKDNGYQHVKGIDIDEGQVKSCKAKGLNVELVEDTVAYLKANPNSFDLITAFDVLEHIPSEVQIDFVNAIYGALKSKGKFIGSVPNANSVLGNRNRYIDYTHWVTFTEISLDFVLYNGGFRTIQILPMEFIFFSLKPNQLIHWLMFKLTRFFRRFAFVSELGFKQGKAIPLSFNLIGVAQK